MTKIKIGLEDGYAMYVIPKNVIKNIIENLWPISELDRLSVVGKGFIGLQIVCQTLGIDDCNILMDNFCFKLILSTQNMD